MPDSRSRSRSPYRSRGLRVCVWSMTAQSIRTEFGLDAIRISGQLVHANAFLDPA